MKRKYIRPVIRVIDDDGALLAGSITPSGVDVGGGAGDDGDEEIPTTEKDETGEGGFVNGAKGNGLEWDFDW